MKVMMMAKIHIDTLHRSIACIFLVYTECKFS